jgi:hypothetical protein
MADEDIIRVGKRLPIVRKNVDNVRSIFVNDMLVNHSSNEFFLIFSSIEPPIVLDTEELNKLEEVESIVRTKLVISLAFAEAIVKTLSQEIETYKKDGGSNVRLE